MPKAVLVTTEFRGVFFGYLQQNNKAPAEITLIGARNCIYWTGCGGFLGLAANGPTKECRIGARIPELTLYKITSVTPVEAVAENAWESAPVWK